MGYILIAVCECGYKSDRLFVGAGMRMEPYRAPLVCQNCGKLEVADFAKRKQMGAEYNCKKCGEKKHFLSEASFHHPAGIAQQFNRSFPWSISHPIVGETILSEYPKVLYFCPGCKRIRMQLQEAGL